MNRGEPLDRDRLSVVAGALLLGLALERFLDVPARTLAVYVLGSPLGVNLSAGTISVLLVAGLAVTGTESLMRRHPLVAGTTALFWIIPGLLGVALASWLSHIVGLGAWTVGLGASAILVPLALAGEYAAVDANKRREPWRLWAQQGLIYLIAALLFTRIYDLGARSLFSSTAVFVVTALLAARLFWPITGQPGSSFLYGGSMGVVLGQMTWVLNYGRLSGWRGGLLLLLLFYVLAGLIGQYLGGRFDRRLIAEYGAIGVIGLVAIVLAAP
jgi:hypothetical protein